MKRKYFVIACKEDHKRFNEIVNRIDLRSIVLQLITNEYQEIHIQEIDNNEKL